MESAVGDESILLETKLGFYEGTWWLPVPYEGSMWDRLFARGSGGGLRCNSHVTLTDSRILVKRMLGTTVEIPLSEVLGVYLCACVGSRYWGKNRILKIVWQRGDDVVCTGIVLMPFTKPHPASWKERIEELIQREEGTGVAEADTDGAVKRIRQDNAKMTSGFLRP